MSSIDVKTIRKELAQALSRKFDDSVGLAVYGAGDTAERWFAPFLEGDVVPDCFIDDTPGKAGTLLYGKPVISFEEAHSKCRSFSILLASIVPRTREIMADSLRKHPVEGAEVCMNWEEYVFCKHAKDVLFIFDMLGDSVSQATYANMILTRMGEAAQNQELTFDRQYFGIPEFAEANFDEVFVDCGAYVGDTLEQFLFARSGVFKKVYAFEPVEKSFNAMRARVERLEREWALSDGQIELIRAGVGERSYQTQLKRYGAGDVPATGEALSGESAHGDIPVISIDNFFAKQAITFLKADIEGYEWKMLHGAKQVIKRDRPKLAVSMYHTPFDLFRLALWIKSVCPDYKFAARQHYCDVVEPVLYAYL